MQIFLQVYGKSTVFCFCFHFSFTRCNLTTLSECELWKIYIIRFELLPRQIKQTHVLRIEIELYEIMQKPTHIFVSNKHRIQLN